MLGCHRDEQANIYLVWTVSVYRLKGYEIPVYEAGTGACSGAPYNTSAYSSTLIYEPEPLAPLKTLHEWLHDLREDGLILTSFIVGIISGKVSQ